MNERIEKLVTTAKNAVEKEEILLPLVLEKFAELIVRECAEQCSNVMDYHAILERFGVEE